MKTCSVVHLYYDVHLYCTVLYIVDCTPVLYCTLLTVHLYCTVLYTCSVTYTVDCTPVLYCTLYTCTALCCAGDDTCEELPEPDSVPVWTQEGALASRGLPGSRVQVILLFPLRQSTSASLLSDDTDETTDVRIADYEADRGRARQANILLEPVLFTCTCKVQVRSGAQNRHSFE